MFNLIIKDILVQKKSVLFALGYCFFLVFAFQSMEQAAPIAAGIAVVYILVINSFAYEDKNKSEIMLNSLPISRRNIVLAKYLSIFIYLGLAILSYMAATLIVSALAIPVKVSFITLEGITGTLLAISLMTSIYLPLFFKFGYIKAKLFNVVMFLFFFFAPTALVEAYHNPNFNQTINSLLEWLMTWSDLQIAALLCGLSLLILFISYTVSVHLYNNREF